MGTQVYCPCGQAFVAPDNLAGTIVQTPCCGQPITVPAASPPVQPVQTLVSCVCGASFMAEPHLLGQQVPCPSCQRPLAVVAASGGIPSGGGGQAALAQPGAVTGLGSQGSDDPWSTDPSLTGLADPTWSGPAGPVAAQLPPAAISSPRPRRRPFFATDLEPEAPTYKLVVEVIVSVALLIAGTLVLVFAVADANKGSRSASWPSTQAMIVSSEVVETQHTGRYRGTSYSPAVQYRYEVEGQSHVGSKISFEPKLHTQTGANQTAAKYSVGTKHPVFYDPTDPTSSVLEAGYSGVSYVIFLIPVVLLGGGTVGLLWGVCSLRGRWLT